MKKWSNASSGQQPKHGFCRWSCCWEIRAAPTADCSSASTRRGRCSASTPSPLTPKRAAAWPAAIGIDSPVGDTGIVVGGANLLLIKLDASVEYALLSDIPSWPNPVDLTNSTAAELFRRQALRVVAAASRAAVTGANLNNPFATALG